MSMLRIYIRAQIPMLWSSRQHFLVMLMGALFLSYSWGAFSLDGRATDLFSLFFLSYACATMLAMPLASWVRGQPQFACPVLPQLPIAPKLRVLGDALILSLVLLLTRLLLWGGTWAIEKAEWLSFPEMLRDQRGGLLGFLLRVFRLPGVSLPSYLVCATLFSFSVLVMVLVSRSEASPSAMSRPTAAWVFLLLCAVPGFAMLSMLRADRVWHMLGFGLIFSCWSLVAWRLSRTLVTGWRRRQIRTSLLTLNAHPPAMQLTRTLLHAARPGWLFCLLLAIVYVPMHRLELVSLPVHFMLLISLFFLALSFLTWRPAMHVMAFLFPHGESESRSSSTLGACTVLPVSRCVVLCRIYFFVWSILLFLCAFVLGTVFFSEWWYAGSLPSINIKQVCCFVAFSLLIWGPLYTAMLVFYAVRQRVALTFCFVLLALSGQLLAVGFYTNLSIIWYILCFALVVGVSLPLIPLLFPSEERYA